MPVFLHEELTGVMSVVVSVSVLFIFAEILPVKNHVKGKKINQVLTGF